MDNDTASEYLRNKAASDNSAIEQEYQLFLQQQGLSPDGQPIPKPPPDAGQPALPPTPPKPDSERTFADMVWAAAADVGGGLIEAFPQFAIGGRMDLLKGMRNSLFDLGDWLGQNMPSFMVDADAQKRQQEMTDYIRKHGSITGDVTPLVGDPKTTTGQIFRTLGAFTQGYAPAAKLLKTAGFGPWATSILAGGASNMITMDPQQGNATQALVQAFPGLQGPITDFLAADPNDPAAENRLKNGIEGVLLGAGVQLTTKAISGLAKMIKVASATRRAAQAPGMPQAVSAATQAQADAKVAVDAFAGAERNPALVRAVKSVDELPKLDPGVPGNILGKSIMDLRRGRALAFWRDPDLPDVAWQFNFANFSDDGFDPAIRTIMKSLEEPMMAARGEKITNAAMSRMANDVGLTVPELLSWAKGQPQPAKYLLAASRLFRASYDTLLEMAAIAERPDAGPAELWAVRHQFTVFQAIGERFVSAASEAGRALNALRQAYQGGDTMYVKAMYDFMAMAGGEQSAKNLSKMIMMLARNGVDAGGMGAAARTGWWRFGADALREMFTAGILWRPTTHLRNTVSNLLTWSQQVYERQAAAKIGAVLGTEAGVAPGEALAYSYGSMEAIKDAFKMAGRSLITGEAQFAKKFGGTVGKVDIPGVISAKRIAIERGLSPAQAALFAQTGMGKVVDLIGNTTRLPFLMLSTSDDFFKTIGLRAELYAQAHRIAFAKGLRGEDLVNEIAKQIANPSQELLAKGITAANYITFQKSLGAGMNHLLAMRNRSAFPIWYVIPFMRTPANILHYSFERSPFALSMPSFWAAVRSGGAERDLALARIATGSALMAIFFDWASRDILSGPGPSNAGEYQTKRRTGWQPWSINLSGNWHSLNGTDPLAMPMAFAGSIQELVRKYEIDPEDMDNLVEWSAAFVAAISQSILDKSWLEGAQRAVTVIENAKRGSGGFEDYLYRAGASLQPFSSLTGTTKLAFDPVQREINGVWDAWKSQLPILSKSLVPVTDLWGRPIQPQETYGRAYDVAAPFHVSAPVNNPIDTEMERLHMGVEKIGRRAMIQNVPINFRDFPEARLRYQQLAGGGDKNALIDFVGGKGTMGMLNDMVQGKGPNGAAYKMQSDVKKAQMIEAVIHRMRGHAQQKLIEQSRTEFPKFYEYFKRKKIETERLKIMPSLNFTPPYIEVPSPYKVAPGGLTVPGKPGR